ncbi:flagellar brake protein [Bacillus sp. JCM 19034]|uniref:flagellar brake protein n=1 Tax=Bacillus sp. JCM 19034 TaxID=1481928 RepID=UPI000780E14B|nr:PilZ domain-containing protein [Bacillus sp. JCM 19034]
MAVYPEDHSYPPLRSVTWDLSGGGCAVIVPEEYMFPNQGEVKVWLAIHQQTGEIYYLQTKCKIVRVTPSKGNLNKRVSLEFLTLSKEERQLVVQYCFEKQLEQRRQKRI